MNSPTLSKGISGNDVKQLQQFLISQGLLDKKYATGYFGDLTENALKKYQSANNLTVDGIVGPQTFQMMKSNDNIKRLMTDPRFAGTPAGDLINEYYKSGDTHMLGVIADQVANGQLVSAGQLQNAADQAKSQTDRYYNEQQQQGKGLLDSYLSGTLGQYGAQSGELSNQFTKDYRDLLNKEGEQGTWSSTARKLRENTLQNTFNNAQQNLYSANQADIKNKLINYGYNYGADNTPEVTLNQTTGGLAKTTATPDIASSSSSISSPYGFVGRVNAEQNAARKALTGENISAQNYNPFKGLSF